MAVSVSFYNCSDDPKDVHKSNRTLIGTYSCNIYDEQNIESPNILLPRNDNLRSANYCYISQFGRYYYCRLDQLPDGREIMNCNVDVLVSFWDEFKGSQCIANRSTSNYNREIKDDMVLVEPTVTISMNALYGSTPFMDTDGYATVMTLAGL